MRRRPQRESLPDGGLPLSAIPTHLRVAGSLLRTVFIATLVVLIMRVSIPQSERIWSAYETPGDLIRIALGLAVSMWILIHMFRLPKDAEGYRTWLYFGLAAVPFALICAIAVW